ncbi:MAG: hypothetical protein RLZZ464_2675, partial [Pseudomonadota bacterium]
MVSAVFHSPTGSPTAPTPVVA